MNDDELRKEVRIYKASKNISYKQIAEVIGIKQRSIYNWLAGQYELSSRNKRVLKTYLMNMQRG